MRVTRNQFEIEREIYHTQWANIREHWSQTFSGVRYLSTLILLAILPLKFLRISDINTVKLGVDPHIVLYVKFFVIAIIALMGIVTFLYQYNHHARSKEARKVVVSIERKWGLYDKSDRFIFQSPATKYSYARFAGGERRLTHAMIVFVYIVLISVTGIIFVVFA